MNETQPPTDFGPFGPPDGELQSEYELLRRFYGFDAEEEYGGLAVADQDQDTRIIVGGRGSGRSIYLRRAYATARMADAQIYALPTDNTNPPDAEVVRRLTEALPQGQEVRGWQYIWRAAVLRGVVSHVLSNRKLGAALSGDLLARVNFEDDFNSILPLDRRYERGGRWVWAPTGTGSPLRLGVTGARGWRV